MTYPLKVVQYVCGDKNGSCRHQSDGGRRCLHPKHEASLWKPNGLAPSWCPLLPEKKETEDG